MVQPPIGLDAGDCRLAGAVSQDHAADGVAALVELKLEAVRLRALTVSRAVVEQRWALPVQF
jgi:hypothetical protein